MKNVKKITILPLLLLLILISSCSTENNKEEDARDVNTQFELQSEEMNEVTIELLLSEFQNWEGNKELGKAIYTLSLDNDKYLLSILPNRDNKQELSWIEMIYFIPKTEDAEITSNELKQMDKLLYVLSPYWSESSHWRESIINKNLPFEESVDNWSLKVDYIIYEGNKEGVYVKVNNLNKTVIESKTYQDSNLSKQNVLANGIREALNAPGHPAICTSVYFNIKGELIIEATTYWENMSKSDKEDIIYLIKDLLSERKEEIGVEGYGQFFSPAGRGLDSFYAK